MMTRISGGRLRRYPADARLPVGLGRASGVPGLASRLEVVSAAPRRRSNTPASRPVPSQGAIRGMIWGLALSVPIWAALFWIVRRLLGAQ
jgi:hypothetical protein